MVQAARLLGIVLIIQSCYTGESSNHITVTIDNNDYTPPSTFDREPPYYRAGTPLELTCSWNIPGRGFYHWTSNCSSTCFVKDELEPSVSTDFLKSTDSGVHTCTIVGSGEERGSANITVHVVGAGIYDPSREVGLRNNSYIVANFFGFHDFNCVSGSTDPNVGDVYDNNGTDIAISTEDPFFTFTRRTGAIHVKSSTRVSFESRHQGIYTCRIPDETGSVVDVHVGLYPRNTKVKLAAKINIKAVEVGLYIVNCTSTDSPATTVTWTKDGSKLDTSKDEGMYTSYQEVKDYNRPSSTYHNVLTIRGGDVLGEYRCDIENRENKTSATTIIGELNVTGHETPLVVGLTRRIRCTSFVNSTLMMWLRQDTMIKNGSSPNLDLVLTPESVALNNTVFTCKARTCEGIYVKKSVLIQVREFMHIVNITGSPGPWHTDNEDTYSLTCDVFADITPDVKWVGPDGKEVVPDNARTIERIVSGQNITLKLKFDKLNTSHAGRYTCTSDTVDPVKTPSFNSSHWDVTIQLPRPTVMVVSEPINAKHFTGFEFKLKCSSQIDEAVVTDVTVNHTWYKRTSKWSRWTEIKNSLNVTVLPVMGQRPEFYSILQFSPLQKKDQGFYYCKSTVDPFPDYPKLKKNESDSSMYPFKISPILKTEIEIDYYPPDMYPDYAPPNYRAASSVTLNCTTMGEKGRVNYRWSSNCSSCFVSGSRLTVTRDFLRSRDMGNHTCIATDSTGSRGSNSTLMNIVGAGIYVEKAQYYYGMQKAQPNNTHVSIYSGPRSSPGNSYSRFVLWCCSNSPESYVGSITDPNGITYTRSFKDLRLYRYSRGSSYGGCIRLEGYRYYGHPLNYDSGVYTCTIPDTSGKNHTILFGLYNNDTKDVPSIYSFTHDVDNPTSVLTLFCVTTNAPPTEITWLKDGMELTDDDVVRKTQRVIYRNSSTYLNTISIYDTLDGHVATYTVIVGNSHGSNEQNHTVEGIKITPSKGRIYGGIYYGNLSEAVTFDCSSDLSPMRIEWHKNGDRVSKTYGSSGHEMIEIISTGDHQDEYKCIAFSSMESQEEKFIINVAVPAVDWATVEITDPTNREPLHDNDHVLTCTVSVNPGLDMEPVVINWYHPDGSLVGTDGRVSQGEQINETDLITKRELYFTPLLHDDGGVYTCKAEVDISFMPHTEPVIAQHKMVVTTQANMQLRIEALTHCSTWERYEAYHLEKAIKKNIEDVVRKGCDCDFDSSEIHSGEFSCRTKRDAVTYRAIINGSSEILNATDILNLIDVWKTTESTMRYHKFRLQLTSTCPISFKTFSELECTGDEERECDKQKGDLLFNSNTCYTFKSCDDGSDDGSAEQK